MNRRSAAVAALLAALLSAPSLAHAGGRATQGEFSIDKGAETWTFHTRFSDETSHPRTVEFRLPAKAVTKDNDKPLKFPTEAAAKAQVAAIRAWEEKHGGPKVTAKAGKGGTVSLKVSGKSATKMRSALDNAKATAETALSVFLYRHRYTRLRNDGIVPDHARLAREYADDVAPLADALAVDAPDARTFVSRALAYVQAIPYEAGKNGADKGYRRPLSVLARNKGDCDSKTTLFLALLESEHPEVASTVVYIPDHAFAGVALEPVAGERTFVRDGTTYVGMEPVGPAKLAPGKVSGASGWHLFWGSAETRAVLRPGEPDAAAAVEGSEVPAE